MDRKEFLLNLWRKWLKPILMIISVIICVIFVYRVFSENGSQRKISLLVVGIGAVMLIAQMFQTVFEKFITKIKQKLSPSVRYWMSICLMVIDYVAPIILGMMAYHFWKVDWFLTASVLTILIVNQVFKIIKENKVSRAETNQPPQ